MAADAFEDLLADGERAVVAGILQHIEEAGIHSGDSAAVLPPFRVSDENLDRMRERFEKTPLRALWDDWSLLPGDVSYPLAGAWVEHLVAKGGRERFLEFFVDQTREHAREVYGSDLESWIEEFEVELRS